MTSHQAEDWHKKGFRIMAARDIYVGDQYLLSYVERTIVNVCQEREDLHNGYIDVDGNYLLAEQPFWVKKNE